MQKKESADMVYIICAFFFLHFTSTWTLCLVLKLRIITEKADQKLCSLYYSSVNKSAILNFLVALTE